MESMRQLDDAPARHTQKLAALCSFLKNRESSNPVAIHKNVPSHEVPKAHDPKYTDEPLDLSAFTEIIEIDAAARTCTAEAGLPFVELVRATMEFGLAPIVVPELKTITIGGAVSGCSIESMSFVYGGFHDTCLEYEVVTADGTVLHCTPDNQNKLVFQMVHGTFGTLGILTRLKFRLVPAKPFVHIRYEKYRTAADYTAAIHRHFTERDVEFMDGMIHSPSLFVLSVGDFTDKAPYTNSYDWMKIYYQSTREREEDFLRTPDYFFRYDKGVTNVHPKSWIGRLLLGRFVGSSEVLGWAGHLHRLLGFSRPRVTVDVFIPFSRFEEFFSWYDETFRFYPVWIVPYRRVRDYEWINPAFLEPTNDELFIDCAVYGMKQVGPLNYYRLMEEELMRIGGLKTLISYNYYSEEEFWRTWNKSTYDEVKARTDPHNIFRDLYTKTCKRTSDSA